MVKAEIAKFIAYLEKVKRYSPNTVVNYGSDLTQFVQFCELNSEPLDSIKNIDKHLIRGWVVSLIKAAKTPATIQRKVATLRSFFKYCQQRSIIEHNPTEGIQTPKNKQRLPSFLKEAETSSIEKHHIDQTDFNQVRNYLMFQVLYQTGIRRAELLQLELASIDFGAKSLEVVGKGQKVRRIPFGVKLSEQLKVYIELRGAVIEKQSSFLFVSKKGNRLSESTVYQAIKKLGGQISTVPSKGPHMLRHTFATQMLNSGADINAIKELLGHKSLSATQIYTHNSIDRMKEVYRQAHPRSEEN